jgi:hypothetical protein
MKKLKNIWKETPVVVRYILISLILIGGTFGVGCTCWWKNYPADNPIEEIIEDLIEDETGIDIDFSP